MRLSSLLAAVALFACAHAQKPAPLRVECTLAQVSADTFRLTVDLSRPLGAFHWSRPGDGDRLLTWRVVEPQGARLETDGRHESLVAGAPFQRAVLELPVHRHMPEKDYAPFLPFSGGGALVYTGQFEVEEADAQAFELRPLQGESVAVPGATAQGPVRWTAIPDGTYAAFGKLSLVDHPRFIGVVDPGFPAWLGDEARTLLPKLFDWYAHGLGRELPGRPAVLLSYGADAERPRSISMKGGTLAGLLQQDVVLGAERQGPNEPLVLAVFRRTLAHEAAHLWNAQVAAGRGPDWVHEGGADLLAWHALRGIGLMDERELFVQLSRAASLCAMLRGSGTLQDDPVKARYACGAIAEAVATRNAPLAAWGVLVRKGGEYDDAGFFAAAALPGPARALVEASAEPAAARIIAALAAAGLKAVEAEPPADFAQQAAREGHAGARWLAVSP